VRRRPNISKKQKEILQQIGLQAFLLLVVSGAVMFPTMWVISLALDPRNIDKPLELRLIPPGASMDAFRRVLLEPYGLLCRNPTDPSSCMTFALPLKNSLIVALGTALIVVLLGATAAYAFSRFRFIGRESGMLMFIVLLMLPTTATLATMFVLLSQVKIGGESLRLTLLSARRRH